MPKERIGDVSLYYEIHGNGDPLLMIMGLGASSVSWGDDLVRELSRSFRTIIFDNRGTGQSDKPNIPYTLEMFANDAAGLLDALAIDRAHVIGVSMGGMIAQEMALRHGPRLQTLTLGCTTAGGRNSVPPPPESMKLLTAPREGLSDADLIRRSWPLSYTQSYIQDHRDELESMIDRILENPTPPFAYMRQLQATYSLKTYDRLPKIVTPTLVVAGANDVLIPARNSEIIAERIPNAQLTLIPDVGHAFFREAQPEFLAAFVPFLEAHPLNP